MKGDNLSRISGDWASSSGVDAEGATGEDADLYRFLHWVKGYLYLETQEDTLLFFIESMVIRDLLSLGF